MSDLCFKKEAEAGNPESMLNLAFHLSGLSEAEDRKAAQWIQKSAELGCKTSMTALGAWHFEGRCVEKSVERWTLLEKTNEPRTARKPRTLWAWLLFSFAVNFWILGCESFPHSFQNRRARVEL